MLIFIIGLVSGIIGGMGMGGGTLLIPFLTLFAGVEQHLAQSINLIAFVPMSLAALFIHSKNGLVEAKAAVPVALSALAFAVLASFGAEYAGERILKILFGAFLIILSVYQFVNATVKKVRAVKAENAKLVADYKKLNAKPKEGAASSD